MTKQSFRITIIAVFGSLWLLSGCMTFRTRDDKMKRRFRKNGVELTTVTEQIDGRQMHFAVTGNRNDTTLLFIHGTPGSWTAFSGYLQDTALYNRFRLISIDRPGFGYSDFGMPLNLENQALLVGKLIQRVSNGKHICLVGHSLGAPLAIKLAADYPSLISSVVLLSGSVDPTLEKAEWWRLPLMHTPLGKLLPGAFQPSNKELWYLKTDLKTLKADFSRVSCPVYIVHGDKDTWVPPANVEYAKKHLHNAASVEIHMLEGGNHFIPWTRFREIRDLLLMLKP